MPADPFFSVVIPVFNRPDFIARAIKSVLDQEYKDWELIVVDDGSTDHTAEVIHTFTDVRIRYIYQQNSERGAARNAGIRVARGKFIMFMDSDDYMLKNHMSEAAGIIGADAEILFFHLNFRIEGANSGKVRQFPAHLNRLLVMGNPFGCTGVVVSRELLKNDIFCEDRILAGTEDYDLWLRLAASYPFHHFDTVTSVLLDHDERSVANQDPVALEKRILFFINRAISDEKVRTFLGADLSNFMARRYSYIALHAAIAGNIALSIRYLKRSLRARPFQAFSIRTLQVLRYCAKNIL